jgi:hypothetical protein
MHDILLSDFIAMRNYNHSKLTQTTLDYVLAAHRFRSFNRLITGDAYCREI